MKWSDTCSSLMRRDCSGLRMHSRQSVQSRGRATTPLRSPAPAGSQSELE